MASRTPKWFDMYDQVGDGNDRLRRRIYKRITGTGVLNAQRLEGGDESPMPFVEADLRMSLFQTRNRDILKQIFDEVHPVKKGQGTETTSTLYSEEEQFFDLFGNNLMQGPGSRVQRVFYPAIHEVVERLKLHTGKHHKVICPVYLPLGSKWCLSANSWQRFSK